MRTFFSRGFVVGLAGVLYCLSSTHAATPAYALTGLGTLGGTRTQSGANSINNSGQIAGTSYSTSGSDDGRAFIWQNGVMTDLGTLGGAWSEAASINSSAQVAGSTVPADDFQSHAFLYSSGQLNDIGMLGNTGADPRAINDSGQIVGESGLPNYGQERAFVYENGQMKNLGTLGGDYSDAFGINNSGQIAGYAGTAGGSPVQHAFRYESGQMTDLGTLGAPALSMPAWGIANNGDVIGQSDTRDGELHAFVYHNGAMSDLGTLGGTTSFAPGINDSGQMVGRSTLNGSGYPPLHAFLYQNGVISDLNSLIAPVSGWTLLGASDINDAGWIVGFGMNPSGRYEGFVLTPVPEPMAAVGFGIGILLLGCGRRRLLC